MWIGSIIDLMRKEPFFVGDIVHVYNRGNRKQAIVHDDEDKLNFLLGLYYLNNKESLSRPLARVKEFLHLRSNLRPDGNFEWPSDWSVRDPLVKIHTFSLLENHYHIILEEIEEGGISQFMRKLSNSMTGYFNMKYEETGRLFQSSYKACRVNSDNYFRYLAIYIMVKNIFELYPGGIRKALKNFDDAFDFAVKYKYSSLSSYAGKEISPIIDAEMLKEVFPSKKEIKDFAEGCIEFVCFDERNNTISTS